MLESFLPEYRHLLDSLPKPARPTSKAHGAHSYTLALYGGPARVEILLRARGYKPKVDWQGKRLTGQDASQNLASSCGRASLSHGVGKGISVGRRCVIAVVEISPFTLRLDRKRPLRFSWQCFRGKHPPIYRKQQFKLGNSGDAGLGTVSFCAFVPRKQKQFAKRPCQLAKARFQAYSKNTMLGFGMLEMGDLLRRGFGAKGH